MIQILTTLSFSSRLLNIDDRLFVLLFIVLIRICVYLDFDTAIMSRTMADPKETTVKSSEHEEESEEECEDEIEECKKFVVRQIADIYKTHNILSKTVDSLKCEIAVEKKERELDKKRHDSKITDITCGLEAELKEKKSEKDLNEKELIHLKRENGKLQGELDTIRNGMHSEKELHDKDINDLKIQNGIMHGEISNIKSGISSLFQQAYKGYGDPNSESNAQPNYVIVDSYQTSNATNPDIATGNELDLYSPNYTATDAISGYEVESNLTSTPMQIGTEPAKKSMEKRRLYQSFDELPESVSKKLKPYNERLSMAKTDKLNPLQRAYVKHFVKCDMKPGVSTKEATEAVLSGGFIANIFNNEEFDADKSLHDYMLSRMKYEINACKKK